MIRAIPQQLVSPLVTSLVATPSGISGFAFPGETLTMPTGTSYQWYVNSDNRGTAQTLLLTVDDIGKTVTGIRNGITLPQKTVWHPNTIPGVARVWVARSNAYTSISPNVLATNGQGVRRWDGIIASTQADQSTGGLQPLYQSAGVGGQPSLLLDGTDDYFNLPGTSDVVQAKTQCYLIVGAKDTNPSGGKSIHGIVSYGTGTGSGSRIIVGTRFTSNVFFAGARIDDADSLATATTANNGNYNVLRAHGDFSNGFIRLSVNGSVVSSTALSRSGATQNTASIFATISAASVEFPGHICGACVVNTAISATDLSRLERYIALLGGTEAPTIALV